MISIFLIDDDPIYLTLARKMISSADEQYQITEFTTAEEAIDLLVINHQKPALLPDIIFVDLSMPVMDGWSFLDEYEEIRSIMSKTAELYIVTSSKSHEDVRRSKKYLGVKDFLVKPVSLIKMKEIADNISNSNRP